MAPSIELPRPVKRRRDSITEFEKSLASAPVASGSNTSFKQSDSQTKSQIKDENDDDYTPYVPLSKRRADIMSISSRRQQPVKEVVKTPEDIAREQEARQREQEAAEELRRERARKERTLLEEAQEVKRRQAELDAKETEAEREAKKEAEILAALEKQQRKLASDAELAKGIKYTDSIKTTWRPPHYIRDRPEAEHDRIREEHHIIVEGDDLPPPIPHFEDMKLPTPILKYLKSKGIQRPSSIQTQGIPTAFAGRDIIGVAHTGSGKTLAFSLPAIMTSLEMESRLPFVKGEGPVAMILCPSRELARQTYEGCVAMCQTLAEKGEYPEIRSLLCMGGINMAEQAEAMNRGVHIVVATPGRLMDMLEKKKLNLENCK